MKHTGRREVSTYRTCGILRDAVKGASSLIVKPARASPSHYSKSECVKDTVTVFRHHPICVSQVGAFCIEQAPDVSGGDGLGRSCQTSTHASIVVLPILLSIGSLAISRAYLRGQHLGLILPTMLFCLLCPPFRQRLKLMATHLHDLRVSHDTRVPQFFYIRACHAADLGQIINPLLLLLPSDLRLCGRSQRRRINC